MRSSNHSTYKLETITMSVFKHEMHTESSVYGRIHTLSTKLNMEPCTTTQEKRFQEMDSKVA